MVIQSCLESNDLRYLAHIKPDKRSFTWHRPTHYNDVIMGTIASQIISVSIVYLTASTGTDQRKHQSSASLPFVRGIHRGIHFKNMQAKKIFHTLITDWMSMYDDIMTWKRPPHWALVRESWGHRCIPVAKGNGKHWWFRVHMMHFIGLHRG